jgi:hypothetical protein
MFQLFQFYVVVNVFSCCNCFIWMLHMFHTDVASEKMSQIFQMYVASADRRRWCPRGRVGPSRGHRRVERRRRLPPRCGEEAQATWCCCGRGRGESSRWPERDGVAPVWKRRGRVIRTVWVADLKRVVRMRARKTELARATQIRADRTEQPRVSGRSGASAAFCKNYTRLG